MSNLLSFMNSGKCYLTIIVDSSGSISSQDFEIAKICVLGLVERTSNDSCIQIINFSDIAEIVCAFSSDKNVIKNSISQRLKHFKQGTNLDTALKTSLKSINTKQRDFENIVVVITDGYPSDNPSPTIASMITMGIKFYNVGVGNVRKADLDRLFIGQNNMIFDKYDDLMDYIKQFSSGDNSIPIGYKFYPTNNKIQKTSETLLISCQIFPSDNNQVFKPNEIELTLMPNLYYHGYGVKVDKMVDISSPYVANLQLRVTPNCGINNLPNSIEFLFKVKGRSYRGYFTLDLAWFSGDLVSNTYLNIFVDGMMGHGKSSVLNLLFNLFSSSQNIDQQFLATRNTTHTTKGIEFNPIFNTLSLKGKFGDGMPIYEDIIEKIKIVLVDKAGISANDNNIDYSLAANGFYQPNPNQIEVSKTPNANYECHSFIFVVSMDSFSNKTEIEQIRHKILDCTNKAKIQPILAITFSDQYEHDEREILKKDIYDLPVERENVFFVTPYINNETHRNAQKDLVGWKLIKRAVEISKQTIFSKMKLLSQSLHYGLSLNDYQSPTKISISNFNTPQNNSPIRQQSKSDLFAPTSPPMSLNSSTSSLPDAAANDKSKSLVLGVNYKNKTTKFRVSYHLPIDDFVNQVSKRFSITNFYLEDQDGCEVSGNSPIGDMADDITELNVCLN